MGAEIIETVETTETEQAITETKEEVKEPTQTDKPDQKDEPVKEKTEDKPDEPKETEKDEPVKEDEPKEDIEAKYEQEKNELVKQIKDTEADLVDVKAQLKKETTKAENYKEQVKTLETVVKGLVDAKLADIPAEYHGLIPSGDSVAVLEWLNKAEESGLFKTKAPAVEIGKPMQLGNPNEKAMSEATPQQKLSNYFSNYFKK